MKLILSCACVLSCTGLRYTRPLQSEISITVAAMVEDLRNIDRCRRLASLLLSPISVHSSPDHELNYDEDQEQDSRLDDCDDYEVELYDDGNDQEQDSKQTHDDGNDQKQDSNNSSKSFHEVMEKIEREVDEVFAETKKCSATMLFWL